MLRSSIDCSKVQNEETLPSRPFFFGVRVSLDCSPSNEILLKLDTLIDMFDLWFAAVSSENSSIGKSCWNC